MFGKEKRTEGGPVKKSVDPTLKRKTPSSIISADLFYRPESTFRPEMLVVFSSINHKGEVSQPNSNQGNDIKEQCRRCSLNKSWCHGFNGRSAVVFGERYTSDELNDNARRQQRVNELETRFVNKAVCRKAYPTSEQAIAKQQS